MTIPSPSVLHFRMEDETRRQAYADIDEFFNDLKEQPSGEGERPS